MKISRPFHLFAAIGLAWLWLAGCAGSKGKAPTGGSAPADTVRAEGTTRPGTPAPTGPGSASAPTPGRDSAQAGAPATPGAAAGKGKAAASATPGKPPAAGSTASPASPAAGGGVTVETDPAPPKAEPLVMENADRMEGFRSRGEYVLSGKVRFTHGDLRLETERAVWLKERSLIYCESGMRIVHRGARLTAERGRYDKNAGEAVAEGKVQMRDSSGEVEAFGGTVTYYRNRHLATLAGDPELRRYYRKAPDTAADTAATAAGSAAKGGAKSGAATAAKAPAGAQAKAPAADTLPIKDTLVIRGKILTYNDSAQIATADGAVDITRNRIHITCQKAEYHDRPDSLYLLGEPQVHYDESTIKGLVMRMQMEGEEIRSLLVKGKAEAKSVEPATDTSVARQSHVLGDSLYLAFKGKSIDSVQVFRNAKGSYFDVDKPGFVNRMSGEYMVLCFNGKQVASANVVGGAKSTYFHLEKRVFKGKNEAEGDTIDFAFKDGKVDEVLVRGQAKGTYFGEPQPKKGKGKAGGDAPADSQAAPPAPAGAGRPAVPPATAAAAAQTGTTAPAAVPAGPGRKQDAENGGGGLPRPPMGRKP